ncbi:flagellar basal-body MS-ring/collar protein FliF [Lachnospiraceae bacterium LCP25S3_G4]
MEKGKELFEKIKALEKKTKRMIIGGILAIILFAVIVAGVLNNRPYAVMFSDVSNDEAQEIITKLQEDNTEYKYQDGNILVKKDVLDEKKAQLVYEGYPKSGFTYDVFTSNAGLMTTDADKQAYKVYELQNRIGATIKLFDGVKDAKVTIALGEDNKYALSDEDDESQAASGTATVIMKDGGSPTKEQALAIQRLVSRSIPKLTFQNVSVFDGNGIEVSSDTSESSTASGSESAELAELVEKKISNNIMNVLAPIYGAENVRVSAKGTINMEQLVRESIQYTTPEKIDKEDKTGIVDNETLSKENSNSGNADGGVAGTDSNADVSEYNTNSEANQNGASASNTYREYLVNQLKEQGTVSPGVLEDLTVSVAINGKDLGTLKKADLQGLVGNAAGIDQADRESKIAIVSTPFYENKQTKESNSTNVKTLAKKYMVLIIAGLAVLLVLIILLIVLKKKRRKTDEEDMYDTTISMRVPDEQIYNEEIINLQNEKGMELKQNIRDFAEQNPEISAQLLRNWLNSGSEGGQDGRG